MKRLKATDTPSMASVAGKGSSFRTHKTLLGWWRPWQLGWSLDKDVYFQNIVNFGEYRLHYHNNDDRLYLTRFDPPENMEDISSSRSFIKLKEFIKKDFKWSVWTCYFVFGGSKRADQHVWFGCRSCIFNNPCTLTGKKAKKTSNYCPFGFQLRWDDKGYYIHLKNSSCPWHTCWKA